MRPGVGTKRQLDRQILRLAVPAFLALVAEPLYVLADTAVVGHLGTPQLAGLGVASSVLLTGYALFVFLAYGTTGTVARLLGAGRHAEAARQAVQGLWLALGLAVVVGGLLFVAAPAVVEVLGADGAVRTNALVYLRISLFGLPALFLTMAGTGYLRGLQDTRTPLVVAVATSVVNLALQLVLIEGFDHGIGASALSTVLAQTGGAAVYLWRVGSAARRLQVPVRPDGPAIRRLAVIGRDLLIRTAALRVSLLAGTAVATRIGTADLAAHQIAFELWSFLALALDAVAIAGQALTGHALGAGDPDAARAAGRRMVEWGMAAGFFFAVLVGALRPWLPGIFSGDREVTALAAFLLWWVAALQPVNGVVFVLDGILIGAGDTRYLAGAMVTSMATFLVAAGAVAVTGVGLGWLWASLGILMIARLATLLARFSTGAWAVPGASR